MKSSDQPKKKVRGKPFEKGNPGKPKGAKNKFPIALRDKVLNACSKLEAAGSDLATEALKDPKWFWETFVKPMLPKEVFVSGNKDNPLVVFIQKLKDDNK
jgi:hypothetical protein